MKISFIFILFLFCSLHSYGTTPKIKVYCNPVLAKSTPDPTVIQAPDGMFYLYATEDIHNIPIYKSPDLVNWTFVGTAFTDATRPTFEPKAGLWAPDINHIDGKYVLYYAMSRWGGEHTCGIGCAVADSPAGPFTDQGKLFRSNEIGVQNSIDPFYIEENGEKYLFWGSFRGIYYIELSEDGLHIRPGAKPTQIAGTAYEAVYVHKKGKYYYLFASIGSCCQGEKSTYTTVVGRSCCRPFSATVATIATAVLAVSFSPLQPSQPSRGLFAFSIIGQRDTSPFVPNLVLIADVVFIQQPARLHIQILTQRICRHADMDGIGKLGWRACPYRLICGHQT